MVGYSFGIGRKFQVLSSHGGSTDSLLHSRDVPVFHPLGVIVNFLLNGIGLVQRCTAFILIGIHSIAVQLVKERLQLADFILGIVGELLGGAGQGGGIFYDVFGIVTHTLQIPDIAVSA